MKPFHFNKTLFVLLSVLALVPLRAQVAASALLSAGATDPEELFAPGNLHAWCAVPFDAKQRGPEERAEMLKRLGFRRFVYDWRAKDIPSFDAEFEAMKKHGIEVTAWWSPTDPADPVLRTTLEVFKRQNVSPQLWVMGSGSLTKTSAEQQERVEQEAERIRKIVELANPYGSAVHLYNHNGWFGIPDNEVAIIERLKQRGVTGVGMVYNFSHGHNDIADFPAIWKRMKPYVVAVNVTGMVENGESKIMPPSQGKFELQMLRVILESGWHGPIGLIAEQGGDAEVTLANYLRGLDWCKKELSRPGSGGPKPDFAAAERAAKQAAKLVPGRFGKALDAAAGGVLLEGNEAWHKGPVTVEAWAKLRNAAAFNVVVASELKESPSHWELYSYAGTGDFSVYLPGRAGEVRSGVAICDDAWHHLAMVLETERVRLFVDGKLAADKPLSPAKDASVAGELGIGRTVDAGIGCHGLVDDLRISRGVREIKVPVAALERDEDTLELFSAEALPVTADAEPPPREPVVPEHWPNHTHPVNRDRTYDFYLKQAQDWRDHPRDRLPQFPGLDGGTMGHWGNQNEDTWRDGRWNEMDVGPCLAGVFHGAGFTIPKAVCVQLEGPDNIFGCYDPVSDEWKAIWDARFLKFSDVRHGLMDGLRMGGNPRPDLLESAGPPPRPAGKYRGYYRHGRKTVFAFELNGRETLRMLTAGNRRLALTTGGELQAFTKGGPAQWPQVLETQGVSGKPVAGWPYVVDTLTLPFDNPWKTLFFVGGHDFFSNGDIALCTMTGDVWRVSGVDATLSRLRWKRMAAGLHQPLGLVVVDDKACVLGRDQITRLHDLNGDGEADFYECLANDFETPTGGHDFMCGLERDSAGNFYTASGRDGLLRVRPGKGVEVIATGFRNPDGLGLAPDGTLTVPYSEGDWTPTSAIAQITHGGFYGYRGPQKDRKTLPPLVWLPRGIDNSSGGQTWVPDDRWGPLKGQMIHTSYGAGTHLLVLRQKSGEVWQGAAVPLPGDFNAGVHRARFSPHDGQLYLSGMTGWGTYTPHDGCLQRVRYTGGPVQVPVAFEARDNGVLLTFSGKLEASAADAKGHFAQCWNYRYSAAYGSPELSLRTGQPGHDVLEITSAHAVNERQLFLEIPQIQPAHQIHLVVQPQAGVTSELFLTVHALALPFTEYPDYRVIAKTMWTGGAGEANGTAKPNPFTKGPAGRALRVEAAAGLQFATKELTARAGERLSITFANPDVLPHNWVLLVPGSLEKVGDLANKLITDPQGFARHYVPDVPEVLGYTDMVNPGKEFTIHIDAPAKAGEYPYICTFPGHWMVMKGVMRVE